MTSIATNIFRRRLSIVAALSAGLAVAGCGNESSSAPEANSSPVSPTEASTDWRSGGIKEPTIALASLMSAGKGFLLGSPSAPRVAYVIFDPRCPHCAALWKASQPVAKEGTARFVWIPVSAISAMGAPLAASIYSAPDPVAAMDAHESLMAARAPIPAPAVQPSEAAFEVIRSNSELAFSLGLEEVPIILMRSSTGEVVVSAGGLTEQKLRTFLAR